MKRNAVAATAGVISLLAIAAIGSPCQAQFMKQLGQELLGGQGQGQLPGMQNGQLGGIGLGQNQNASFVGNVNLPQGQYMMTNLQTNQAFYVTVQSGQMFFSADPNAAQQLVPGAQGLPQQQGGIGGMVKNGLGSFLKNQMQQPQPQQ